MNKPLRSTIPFVCMVATVLYATVPVFAAQGDTLVIDTTNFNGKVGVTRNGNTAPTSTDLRLVERLTRTAADTIQYEATVNDPRIWVRPWTVALPLKQHPEYGMFEYACHEGNYAMKNILSAARSDEEKEAVPFPERR